MIIRSQDKKKSVNFNKITTIRAKLTKPKEISKDRETEIVCTNEDGKVIALLGIYSSMEKAYMVLDKIDNSYEMQNSVFIMPQDKELNID